MTTSCHPGSWYLFVTAVYPFPSPSHRAFRFQFVLLRTFRATRCGVGVPHRNKQPVGLALFRREAAAKITWVRPLARLLISRISWMSIAANRLPYNNTRCLTMHALHRDCDEHLHCRGSLLPSRLPRSIRSPGLPLAPDIDFVDSVHSLPSTISVPGFCLRIYFIVYHQIFVSLMHNIELLL
jgi:hypothetical protein